MRAPAAGQEHRLRSRATSDALRLLAQQLQHASLPPPYTQPSQPDCIHAAGSEYIVLLQMLGDGGARVGAGAGRDNPRNRFVNEFLQEVRDRAQPVDLDHPEDEGIADGGKRVDNIRKASRACSALIEVHRC